MVSAPYARKNTKNCRSRPISRNLVKAYISKSILLTYVRFSRGRSHIVIRRGGSHAPPVGGEDQRVDDISSSECVEMFGLIQIPEHGIAVLGEGGRERGREAGRERGRGGGRKGGRGVKGGREGERRWEVNRPSIVQCIPLVPTTVCSVSERRNTSLKITQKCENMNCRTIFQTCV